MKTKKIFFITAIIFLLTIYIASAIVLPPKLSVSVDKTTAKAGATITFTATSSSPTGISKMKLGYGTTYDEKTCGVNNCTKTWTVTSLTTGQVVYNLWSYDNAGPVSKKTIIVNYVPCLSGETQTQSCGTNVGLCGMGTQTKTCTNNAWPASWGACVGAIDPVAEICDNKDNDCDGTNDNGLTIICSSNANCDDSDIHTLDTCNNAGTCFSSCSYTQTNNAPVLASIGNQNINEGETLTFGISATDADNDALTYSATGLPSGAAFSSQTFTWTPTYSQSGSYQVTFTADDGDTSDSKTITITVNEVCVENWVADDACQNNDGLLRTYTDSNNCGTTNNRPSDHNTIVGSCDYCLPNWQPGSWGSCQITDTQSRSYNDANNCFAITGLSSDSFGQPSDETQSCDYCTPSWTETNGTCQNTDTLTSTFSDLNNCYATTGLSSDNNQPSGNIYTCDYCTPSWQATPWSACMVNDTEERNYFDTNSCYSQTGLSNDLAGDPGMESQACDYCTPSWQATGAGPCLINDTQAVTYTDSLSCFAATGLLTDNNPPTSTQPCDYCTPLPTNSSWSDWFNLTGCLANDTYNQQSTRFSYDANNCYSQTGLAADIYNNITYSQYQSLPCDFCTPNLLNTTWSAYADITTCRINDTKLQQRSLTQYDSNYCGEISNQTFTQQQEVSCDYCTPSWTLNTTWGTCFANETQSRSYYDSNNCYAQTSLASDLLGKPVDETQTCSYDNDGDGFNEAAGDCNDANNLIKPGAAEVCDGIDNNCNAAVDEGFPDTDSDGNMNCVDPDDDSDGVLDVADNCPLNSNPDQANYDGDSFGNVCDADDDNDGDPDTTDCAPLNAQVYTGATEVCDSIDNNCNSQIDELFSNLGQSCSAGVGVCRNTGTYVCSADKLSTRCNAIAGTPTFEICNNLDDNCNGQIDDGLTQPTANQNGQCAGNSQVCIAGVWNDSISNYIPSAEICNSLDDDCNPTTTDGSNESWFNQTTSCGVGECHRTGNLVCSGGVQTNICIAGTPVLEVCDNKDNDCDATVDEGLKTTFYQDFDTDTYGNLTSTTLACSVPTGYSSNSNDCNDNDNTIYLGAPEALDNINQNCMNDAPVAANINKTTNEDTSVALTLSCYDVDGDQLSYAILSSPSRGVLAGSGTLRTYTPSANLNGADSFTYRCTDGSLNSNTATVSINITPVNDAPVMLAIGNKIINENQILTFLISATDVEGNPLTYSASGLPSGAAFNSVTRNFSWTPDYTQAGIHTVTFTVSDGYTTNSETITITVNNVCVENWVADNNLCQANDQKLISYTDSNACGTAANLPADNATYSTCDYCTPSWTLNTTWGTCYANETQSRSYYDSNNCYAQTSLASDLLGKPANEVQTCSYDNDGDGFSESQGDCNDNNLSINPGATEIANNGIDEDCSGADLIIAGKLNITILSPTADNQSATWYGSSTMKNWNISIIVNDTANSCWYEFGQREDFWVAEPIYYSITSTGTLDKINGTNFTKINVDPLNDHNYLRVFCNNTAGQVFNTSMHVEIDRIKPGTINDLKVLWNNDIQKMNLSFTIPGSNGFNIEPRIRYYDIRWSRNPINTSNWNNASIVQAWQTDCYDSVPSGNTNVMCYIWNPPCDATWVNYTTGVFYDSNNNPISANASLCYAYQNANGTWVKPEFYYAIKTYDNVGWASNVSNSAGNYTPVYDCSIENVIFKKKNSTAPFESNLSKVGYETLYNYDDIILNFTVRNNGDVAGCEYSISNDNILGAINQHLNLIPNQTQAFTYNWTVMTPNIQEYKSTIQAFGNSGTDMADNGLYQFDLYGINVSKYLYILANNPQNTGTLPHQMTFAIGHYANSVNTSGLILSTDLDKISWRWIPVKLNYAKIDAIFDPIISNADTGMNTSLYPAVDNLPQEFYDYTCITSMTCLKPYARYSRNDGWFKWNMSYLEPTGIYNFWMTAETYSQETVSSNNVTVFYG